MTNDNSQRTIDQLFDELETVAARLRDKTPHFEIKRGVEGWYVKVFVAPIADAEVRILMDGDRKFGVIEAKSNDLSDVLATALSICWAVDRDRAVTA